MSFRFKRRIHCRCGTYEHAVTMPIKGRVHDIDLCIADIIAALNAGGVSTCACCCGHGKMDGTIWLDDGRELSIKWGKRK